MRFVTEELLPILDSASATDLEQRLQGLLSECKNRSTQYLFTLTDELHRALQAQCSPAVKMKTLTAVRLFFQTCEYQIVNFIQIYLLPIIFQTALGEGEQSRRAHSRHEDGESTWTLGESDELYQQACLKFILMAKEIKDKRHFKSKKLKQASRFSECAMRLYERGAQRDQLNYHYIKKLRMLKIKFEQNLVAFEENTEDYVSFFVSKAEQYLQNPVVSGIDFRDMLQSGDSFLTPEIIGLVYGYLEQTNFQLKLQALLFLNQFIQWADGEALALANEAEIDTIVQAVMRANSSEGNLASNFYPEVNGQEQPKLQFYFQFLKCLQFWAACIPDNSLFENHRQGKSSVAESYECLQAQLVFPANPDLKDLLKEFEKNFARNKKRNEMIVKDIKDLLISDSIASKSAKDSEIKSFFGFERLVEDCERSLRGLCRHKDTVDQYMQNLRKFKNTFEEKILSRNQAEDAGNYFKRGQRCVNKFEQLEPIYNSYAKGVITFDEFVRRVTPVTSESQGNLRMSSPQLKYSMSSATSKIIISLISRSSAPRTKHISRLQEQDRKSQLRNESLIKGKKQFPSASRLSLDNSQRRLWKEKDVTTSPTFNVLGEILSVPNASSDDSRNSLDGTFKIPGQALVLIAKQTESRLEEQDEQKRLIKNETVEEYYGLETKYIYRTNHQSGSGEKRGYGQELNIAKTSFNFKKPGLLQDGRKIRAFSGAIRRNHPPMLAEADNVGKQMLTLNEFRLRKSASMHKKICTAKVQTSIAWQLKTNSNYQSPRNLHGFDSVKEFEGTLFPSKQFDTFLQKIDRKTYRQRILTDKELIHSNADIEIGLKINSEDHMLKMTYFITALKPLKMLVFRVEDSCNLRIRTCPKMPELLPPQVQQLLHIFVEVIDVPYTLPAIWFGYSLGASLTPYPQKFISNELPVYFSRFVVVTRPSPDKVANLFSRGVIIRGKEIVYDRKMVSQHTKILKYLPNLLLLEDSKQLVVYAGKGRYKLTEFVFKVNIKLNNFLCVQGVLYDSEAGQEKMIKYYICSLNQLFSSH